MSILYHFAALACLLALLVWPPPSMASEILLAASNDSPALRRFVADLAARRPGDRVRLVPASELTTPSALPADSRLVLLGADALDWRLSDPDGPPTLVMRPRKDWRSMPGSGRTPATAAH